MVNLTFVFLRAIINNSFGRTHREILVKQLSYRVIRSERFSIREGVEAESVDAGKFKVTEQMMSLVSNGGKIFACGSFLKLRHPEGSENCQLSTMKELYAIIKESEKIVTF